MSLGEIIQDTRAGMEYGFRLRNRGEEASGIYDAFKARTDHFHHVGKITFPPEKPVSLDFPGKKGSAIISRFGGMLPNEQVIRYFRNGKLDREGWTTIVINHQQDNDSGTESSEVKVNDRRPNSAGSLRIARRELNLMQNATLSPHRL